MAVLRTPLHARLDVAVATRMQWSANPGGRRRGESFIVDASKVSWRVPRSERVN